MFFVIKPTFFSKLGYVKKFGVPPISVCECPKNALYASDTVTILFIQALLNAGPTNTPTEGGEGSLDTSMLDGNSIQRTGYITTVDEDGNTKTLNLKDGTAFNSTTQRLGDILGITKTTGDNYIFVNNDFVDYYEGSTETSDEANNLIAMFDGTVFHTVFSADEYALPTD